MSSVQYLHQSIAKPCIQQANLLHNSPLPLGYLRSSQLEYSRSSTKRIYDSVFRIIDFEDSQQGDYKVEETNGSKIMNLESDEALLCTLYQKMKNQSVFEHYPILKVCCQQIICSQSQSDNAVLNYNSLYQLQFNDMTNTFNRFGDLNKIMLTQDMKFAYIFFNSFHSAYISCKLINGVEFKSKMARIHVNWADSNDCEYLMPNSSHYLNSINWHLMYKFCSTRQQQPLPQLNSTSSQKQNKLTCRYDIQIQNERDFQVARRIIGSKGCNMKKIIEQSIELAKGTQSYRTNPRNLDNPNQLLKLRLRGKGSGYKQGPEQQQSQQTLHLCVSAKDQTCYQLACQKVQKLLQNVYEQYYQYTLQQDGRGVMMQILKSSLGSITIPEQTAYPQYDSVLQPMNGQSQSYYTQQELNSLRMTPQKICELLEMRNKARRELNFLEADRIRNFLRNCGVCLIDEKGRRGRAMEVTTWKYIF